jgi:predicted AlkP superfamily pyrophosphatase or phosphodiesterase
MIEQDHSSGPRVAILNVVGLCSRLLGKSTPRLSQFARQSGKKESIIKPVVPAVTCTAQSTYLTGKTPNEHGIVGNGWYDRTLNEHHFWKQSNRLVEGEKIWETLRDNRPDFTCANLFWWYNMYSSVDYSITPRPLYRSDGLKKFDIHSQPLSIRNDIKKDLGEFPFPAFWGPRAGIDSSQWIAEAARWIEERHQPDLNLNLSPSFGL